MYLKEIKKKQKKELSVQPHFCRQQISFKSTNTKGQNNCPKAMANNSSGAKKIILKNNPKKNMRILKKLATQVRDKHN